MRELCWERFKVIFMKKLFVSVPMRGRTKKDVAVSIAKMKKIAKAYEGEELELIDSYVSDEPPKDCYIPVWYLSRSLEKLAMADVFIGIDDTADWPGCKIEAMAANLYYIKSYKVEAENYYIKNLI